MTAVAITPLCGCSEPHTWDSTTPCTGRAPDIRTALAAALERAHAAKNDPTSVETDGHDRKINEDATLYCLDPDDFDLYIDLLTVLATGPDPVIDALPPGVPQHIREAFERRDIRAVVASLADRWTIAPEGEHES